MNNKSIAGEIVDSFNLNGFLTDLELLKSSIEKALDKAAGIEDEFKFGDPVLLWDVKNEFKRQGIFSHYGDDIGHKYNAMIRGGLVAQFKYCIPDPAFSHTLHFVEHRGGKCPVDEEQIIYVKFDDGTIDKNKAGKFLWDGINHIERYAVVTEDFLE